jgi:hypothetical protein
MGVSKHRKGHKAKLADYKARTKRDQDAFKKKMIDHYTQMQQQAIANQQSHTSTEEVSGPDIDIDDLNMVEDLSPVVDVDNLETDINVDLADLDKEWNDLSEPLDKPIEL